MSAHAAAFDGDRARLRVDRVLNQLGDRLARISLGSCQPPDEIEWIGRLQPEAAGPFRPLGPGGPFSPPHRNRSSTHSTTCVTPAAA
jgi:hypothetical protein